VGEENQFDAVVVGAGPAGLACAYLLAKAGKAVLIIERGDAPGAKNVTGGRIYAYALNLLDQELLEDAAWERKVSHEEIMIIDGKRSITIDYHDPSLTEGDQSIQSYTVLRAVFDQWMAGKAEEVGAMLVCGIRVDDLIQREGRVVGVIAGEDEIYAEMVIAADGVNSIMAQKAGLISDLKKETVGVGVKEVIELPAKTIEERELMRNVAREFVEKEVLPVSLEMDMKEEYPLHLFRRAGELGLIGVVYPEEFGGLGGDWVTKLLITEELSKGSPTLNIAIGAHSSLAGGALNLLGTPEQKHKYLTPAVKGEQILALASTEAAGCFNMGEFQSFAYLDGDEWVINGSKIFITNIGVADTYIVTARTADHYDHVTRKGFSMFIVEKDNPGLELGKFENKLGWHGSNTGPVYFKNCRVPKENLLGPLHDSVGAFALSACDEYMSCGAVGLGIAEACYDRALAYTKERMQQGKSMYEAHQVIRHKFARMATEIECLRALSFNTAAIRDTGTYPLALARMCKTKGYETAMLCANEAVQLFGGLGVVRETGVERYLRDARLLGIAGGAIEALFDQINMFKDNNMEFIKRQG
jgi:alkylation response protein AidB-like acyl-CoA dehydrogenase